MKIHEYQARGILSGFGVPVAKALLAFEADGAAGAFDELGGGVAAVKAQILAGGRGKAGGVVIVRTAGEAREAADRLLGERLITSQTAPSGEPVKAVMIQKGLDIEREFYAGVAFDRGAGFPVLIASGEGGVDIEELSRRQPGKVVRVAMDPVAGPRPYAARRAAEAFGLTGEPLISAQEALYGLARAFWEMDASLAEINPLVLTAEGRVVAVDSKMVFDDNALFRHKDISGMHDPADRTREENLAMEAGLNYVSVGGDIGCMVNGAGLAMATMDLIRLHGGNPANFLDVGGGADAGQVAAGFRILQSNPGVKAILVNIFGGIMRCDVLARGIVEAARETGLSVPMVVRLEGTNVEEGRRLLRGSDLSFIEARDMGEAASMAVRAARNVSAERAG